MRDTLKLALEALEIMTQPVKTNDETTKYKAVTKAITAIKQALAAPVQEPEWKQVEEGLRFHGLTLVKTGTGYAVLKLGTVQAQTTSLAQPAQRKPLTDVMIKEWAERHDIKGVMTDLRCMAEDAETLYLLAEEKNT